MSWLEGNQIINLLMSRGKQQKLSFVICLFQKDKRQPQHLKKTLFADVTSEDDVDKALKLPTN